MAAILICAVLAGLLVYAAFWLPSIIMTGKRQTLAAAFVWQSEHYDTSFYEGLEKTDYVVKGFEDYELHGGWSNAYRALGFIDTCCTSDLTPARRAMHTACHALALEIDSDEVLTLLLLGGLAKEKDISEIETAVPEKYRGEFRALINDNIETTQSVEAMLAQCIDCVYVLSTAAIDLSRTEAATAVNKAEEVILPLLKTLKNEKPEWNNAVYLLRYQALALIETYKRLL